MKGRLRQRGPDQWGIIVELGYETGPNGKRKRKQAYSTFHGKKRWEDDVDPHESPRIMLAPMIVLAFGSCFLGLILGPTGWISDWQRFLDGSPSPMVAGSDGG